MTFQTYPQQGGHHIRVFDNKSIDNDTDNFAPEGNIVGEVPRGTGIIIMANSDVEIFDNLMSGNGTVNLSIVSYGDETDDPNYYLIQKIFRFMGILMDPVVLIQTLKQEN